jgi:hypothetical protein
MQFKLMRLIMKKIIINLKVNQKRLELKKHKMN